jgi:phosphoribosylformylglycinamidine (FGAM) synthase PurS component
MRYHIMFTYFLSGQRYIQVMDFKAGKIIRFTIDELSKDELPVELKDYIKKIRAEIENGRWDINGSF